MHVVGFELTYAGVEIYLECPNFGWTYNIHVQLELKCLTLMATKTVYEKSLCVKFKMCPQVHDMLMML